MKKKTIMIIVVAALILFVIYPFWQVHDAKTRVNRFSQQISVGIPIETVESLSQKLNLKIIKIAGNDSKQMKLIVWDGWVFARWSCLVSFENNKVVGKEVSFVD
jgi:hypothetical protein